jgi:glutamate racemase
LSILKEIHRLNQCLEIYYFADTLHNPYGQKSQEFIKERSSEITKELIGLGCELIVVACNTATAWAIDHLRTSFPQVIFVGVEPYINVINHRPDLKEKKGVVLTTPLTGQSQRYTDLVSKYDQQNILKHFSPQNLAPIIEDNFLDNPESLKKQLEVELAVIDASYDYYILGCTHYPLVSKELSEILDAEMISPCPMVAKRVMNFVKEADTCELTSFHYFNSKDEGPWQQLTYQIIFNN